VPGLNDSGACHVKGSHEVMGQEQIIVVSELKSFTIPSQPTTIHQAVINHVTGAELKQSVGKFSPPRWSLVKLSDGTVLLRRKGHNQANA